MGCFRPRMTRARSFRGCYQMSGIEGVQANGDVEETDEGLLNLARAVWQAR